MRLPGPRLMGLRGAAMELFIKLFGDLLVFVYHCFDRIVIHGYLSGLSRPEQVVYFFRHVVGAPVVSKELLSQRTAATRTGSRPLPAITTSRCSGPRRACARKTMCSRGYAKWCGRMRIKSMEQGPSFRVTVPKFPTKD